MLIKHYFSIIILFFVLKLVENSDQTIQNFQYSHQSQWGKIWPRCANGKLQSPININTTSAHQSKIKLALSFQNMARYYFLHPQRDLKMKYIYSILEIQNHQINQICKYRSVSINIKSAGQHSIDNAKSDLELNIHYQKIQGNKCYNTLAIVVIRIFIDDTIIQDTLGYSLRILDTFTSSRSLNFNKKGFYIYRGSLTRPPCSEIVTWVISEESLFTKAETVKLIKKFVNNGNSNNRYLQNFQNQQIYYSLLS